MSMNPFDVPAGLPVPTKVGPAFTVTTLADGDANREVQEGGHVLVEAELEPEADGGQMGEVEGEEEKKEQEMNEEEEETVEGGEEQEHKPVVLSFPRDGSWVEMKV